VKPAPPKRGERIDLREWRHGRRNRHRDPPRAGIQLQQRAGQLQRPARNFGADGFRLEFARSADRAARRLRDALPSARLVFMTMHQDPRLAAEAFKLGAYGRRFLTSRIERGEIEALPAPAPGVNPVAGLTARAREVLALLVEGKAMKEAAAVLGITPRTVAFHKYRMRQTLDVRTSAELIRFAIDHHLL
jgi:DNA-binding NarL/FixJ family response regulator